MLSTLRARLTFANVVSVIALFVALGGSSYAAIKVTGKNVTDSSLTGKDVKNSSLTTSDVKNGSLLSNDFKSGQLSAGPKGDRGEQGSKGDFGAPRLAGSTGISGYEVLSTATANNSDSLKTQTIACPGSKHLLGATSEVIAPIDINAPIASQGGHMLEDTGYQAYGIETSTYAGDWTHLPLHNVRERDVLAEAGHAVRSS